MDVMVIDDALCETLKMPELGFYILKIRRVCDLYLKAETISQREELQRKYENINRVYSGGKSRTRVNKTQIYCSCGKEFSNEREFYVCLHCGHRTETLEFGGTFSDVNRVSTKRFEYKISTNFRETCQRYCGVQYISIPVFVLDDLREFTRISHYDLRLEMKIRGFSKYFDDINYIHYEITKELPPDIEEIIPDLILVFDAFSNGFLKFRGDRKNQLNSLYLLVRFLEMMKKPEYIPETILNHITKKTIETNDALLRQIFAHLKWNFPVNLVGYWTRPPTLRRRSNKKNEHYIKDA